MADGFIVASGGAGLSGFVPLFRELVFLKRIRSAGREGSVATRLFLRAWGGLAHGEKVEAACAGIVGSALAAFRLGDLDAGVLRDLHVEPAPVMERALTGFGDVLDSAFLQQLRAVLLRSWSDAAAPGFALRLAEQPRAGITCPGLPRIGLAFTENHAEHCLSVAVAGALLAHRFGAEPSAVFLAGLAHHFHNALMPDSGFAGEVLLGRDLEPAIARARDVALAELPPALQGECRVAFDDIAGDQTPSARAFHAADVLDRVLEVEANLAPSRLNMADVLGRYALVHEGPVKAFHDHVLDAAGLLCS